MMHFVTSAPIDSETLGYLVRQILRSMEESDGYKLDVNRGNGFCTISIEWPPTKQPASQTSHKLQQENTNADR